MRLWLWGLLAAVWLVPMLPPLWRRLHVRPNPWPAWQVMLGGEMEERYAYLCEVFDGNAAVVDAFLGGRDERVEAPPRTRDSMGWGLTALEGFVATARERIEEWRVLAGVVEAEVPARWPAPCHEDFRRPELRRLMWMDALRGRWSTSGWLASRLRLLGRGFGLVGEAGAALAARVAGEAWTILCGGAGSLAHDFRVLSRETLASARVLLAALDKHNAGT